MEIVPATEEHIPAIIELWKEFMEFHKDIYPLFPLRDDALNVWEPYLRESMKSEDACVLVAVDRCSVIAYAIALVGKYPPLYQHQDHGSIDELAVTANYRRRGVGERMLAAIFEWFDARNIARIDLGFAAGNQVACSFWKKHGFTDFSRRLYMDRSK